MYWTGRRSEKHTLGIKEDSGVLEVWPFEHTPKFLDVLSSVGSHCPDEL
jgi:hypothetical protein